MSNFRGEATGDRGEATNFCGEATNFRGEATNFRGEATNVVRPLPANHPASVCALLPHGSTNTHTSQASIASMSLWNCRSALG